MGKETVIPSINYEKAEFQLSLQGVIRQNKPDVSRRFPDNIGTMIDQSEEIIQSLLVTEDGQKNFESIHQLADNLNIPLESLKNTYFKGVKYNIKAGYRLGFFDINQDNRQLIENLIGSYTLSFRQTLRSFDKKRDQSQRDTGFILDVASKLYLLKPNVFQELQQLYRDDPFISQSMIKHFIINNPFNPKAAIEKAKDVSQELQQLYQGDPFIDQSVIEHFIINNPSNPKAAIEKAKDVYFKLKEEYQEDNFVEDWMFKYFIINNPSNPKAAIEKAKSIYLELKKQYSNIRDWVLKHFIVKNPSNPEMYIKEVQKVGSCNFSSIS